MKSISGEDEREFPVPVSKRPKLSGMEFYTRTLGSPRLVVMNWIYMLLIMNGGGRISMMMDGVSNVTHHLQVVILPKCQQKKKKK